MNLKGVVSVSGKPGLFKLIGQNKTGFVLESLDNLKVKSVVNLSTTKMASLEDITIFGEEDDIQLPDIFEEIRERNEVPNVKEAGSEELRAFFRGVAPNHDEDRVYTSDIKKIVSWYNIIKELPLFNEESSKTDEDPAASEQ